MKSVLKVLDCWLFANSGRHWTAKVWQQRLWYVPRRRHRLGEHVLESLMADRLIDLGQRMGLPPSV